MINISIRIPNIKTNIQPAIQKSLWQSAQLVRRSAIQKAPHKTGALRRSIVETGGNNQIEVWTNLIYAPIHEFWWTIYPKNWKYLIFKMNGKLIRTKRVVIPKRPYLWPALEENKNEILSVFTRNLWLFI